MHSYRAATLLSFIVVASALALAACGDSGAADTAAPYGSTVTVTAGDSSCELDRTDLDVGVTTFAVTNTGSRVTEVYVYGADGDDFTEVVSEVENIGPGISRDMVVELAEGTYEVACKPGQMGGGIRTTISVAPGTAGEAEEAVDSDTA